jgi:hypothetical protein
MTRFFLYDETFIKQRGWVKIPFVKEFKEQSGWKIKENSYTITRARRK